MRRHQRPTERKATDSSAMTPRAEPRTAPVNKCARDFQGLAALLSNPLRMAIVSPPKRQPRDARTGGRPEDSADVPTFPSGPRKSTSWTVENTGNAIKPSANPASASAMLPMIPNATTLAIVIHTDDGPMFDTEDDTFFSSVPLNRDDLVWRRPSPLVEYCALDNP
jgi:hypothetical protein